MPDTPLNQDQAPKLWTKNFFFLIVVFFSNSFCFQMLNSTLALYVESLLGPDSGISGLVSGAASLVFTVAIVITRPLGAWLIGKVGRKSVITIGAALVGIGCLLNAFIPTVAALIVLRLIQGLGSGTASTAVSISAIHVIPPERLTEGLGKSGVGSTFAMVIGPSIALALISGGNFKLPFFVVFICSCITIFGSMQIHTQMDDKIKQDRLAEKSGEATTTESAATEPGKKKNRFWSLIERDVLAPSCIQLLIMISFASFTTYLTIYASRRGYTTAGYFFALASIVMIITQYAFSKVGDRKGPLTLIIPGFCFSIASFIALSLTHNEVAFMACSVLYGIGSGLIMPVMAATTVKGVSEEKKSAASATFYCMYDVGLGLGAMFWGVIVDAVGIDGMYIGAASTMALGCLLAVYVFGIKKWHRRLDSPKTQVQE